MHCFDLNMKPCNTLHTKFGVEESTRICLWSDDQSLLLMLIFHLLFVVSGMRRSSTFASHLCLKYIWKGILPWWYSELQKRADRADQLVLFFLAGANFWEKHAKNCAIMSMAHITYAIAQ